MTKRTTEELLQMVQIGAGLDLEVGKLSHDDLLNLASKLNENATLILRGLDATNFSTADIIGIKRISPGNVIFVLE
jgi:hypothetical protein